MWQVVSSKVKVVDSYRFKNSPFITLHLDKLWQNYGKSYDSNKLNL